MQNGKGIVHVERWERPEARLGSPVYRPGRVSNENLDRAREEGRRTGRQLGQILLQRGWVGEKDLARLLTERSTSVSRGARLDASHPRSTSGGARAGSLARASCIAAQGA